MKYIIFLLIVSIPFACKKDVAISIKGVSGTWILTEVSGGFTGSIPMPSGIHTVSFEPTGNYTKAVDYETQESGTYSITLEKTIFSEDKLNVMHFMPSQGNMYDMVLGLNENILSLSQNAYDGVNYAYTKQK